MPIQFKHTEIESFFGAKLAPIFADSGREQYWLDYSGGMLKYSMVIDVERDAVMISADTETPWGARSLYEIGVPCTSINILQIGRDEFLTLSCFYGDSSDRRNRTLTIIKRPDADLIVWSSWPYPQGHPYAYSETKDEPQSSANEMPSRGQEDMKVGRPQP